MRALVTLLCGPRSLVAEDLFDTARLKSTSCRLKGTIPLQSTRYVWIDLSRPLQYETEENARKDCCPLDLLEK